MIFKIIIIAGYDGSCQKNSFKFFRIFLYYMFWIRFVLSALYYCVTCHEKGAYIDIVKFLCFLISSLIWNLKPFWCLFQRSSSRSLKTNLQLVFPSFANSPKHAIQFPLDLAVFFQHLGEEELLCSSGEFGACSASLGQHKAIIRWYCYFICSHIINEGWLMNEGLWGGGGLKGCVVCW